ncbi:gb [Venturia nashicola]|nr:gb [Venturia nashicola]
MSPTTNSTNTPSNLKDCIVTGNADFYGFGIRLGTYFQFFATLLVTLCAPKEEDFYRALNNLLQTAMFAGLIILTRTQYLLVIEPVIVVFLLFGSLSSLTGEGFSPIGRPSGIYRLLLYCAITGYSCWFWFIGIDNVAKPLSPSECHLKTTAFFGQVSPYGAFRTFNKVASVLGILLCLALLIWSCIKFLRNGGSRKQPRERTIDAVLLLYSFTVIIVSIVGAEWIIRANHMTEVYDVKGVGQIIPLLVGALGMIEALKDVLLGVVKSNPPRQWTFFGKTKGYWVERWATAFWRQRGVPSSNTSSIAPADSSSTRAMALDDLDKKTPPINTNSADE